MTNYPPHLLVCVFVCVCVGVYGYVCMFNYAYIHNNNLSDSFSHNFLKDNETIRSDLSTYSTGTVVVDIVHIVLYCSGTYSMYSTYVVILLTIELCRIDYNDNINIY